MWDAGAVARVFFAPNLYVSLVHTEMLQVSLLATIQELQERLRVLEERRRMMDRLREALDVSLLILNQRCDR